ADLDNNLVRKLTPGASAISPAPLTQMSPARLLHKATLREGPVAPGQLLTIVAEGIGSATVVPGVVGAGGALDTLLAETQVLFDGRPAPLLELRLGQIDVQVPYSVAGQTSTHVEIFQSGALRVDTATAVTSVSPGIFTQAGGAGPARVTNEDGALNGAGNPADPGSVITVFATGEGQTFPAGIDGMRATLPYPQPLLPVGLAVGGRAAEVLSATAAPGTVGMLRVRARVPAVSAGGAIPLALSIGTFVSQEGVTVFVK
ncbi:MAG TPA: hypothetical protein VL285_05970, partial [Bryobacteraceae bacterium]|nr:hypothetical protein [Bryobacteraceae bacterium]